MKHLVSICLVLFLCSCKCKFTDSTIHGKLLSNIDSVSTCKNYQMYLMYYTGKTSELGGCSSSEQDEYASSDSDGNFSITLRRVNLRNQKLIIFDSARNVIYDSTLKNDIGTLYVAP